MIDYVIGVLAGPLDWISRRITRGLITHVRQARRVGGERDPGVYVTAVVENPQGENAFVEAFEVEVQEPFKAAAVKYEHRSTLNKTISQLALNIPGHGVSEAVTVMAFFDRNLPYTSSCRARIAAVGRRGFRRRWTQFTCEALTESDRRAEAQLDAGTDERSVLHFGAPIRHEDGVLRRTQERGTIETSVGTAGPLQRVVTAEHRITNYRVPIANAGAAVHAVRVKLVEISPEVPGVSGEVPLHISYDDPPLSNYVYRESFPLARKETVQLDVVAMDNRRPECCYIWNSNFEDAVQEVKLGGTHIFTLRAYAGNVTAEARYKVYADAMSARLEMEGPLQDPSSDERSQGR